MTDTPTLEALRAAVELACQPTHIGHVLRGRELVLAMRRAFVLENIEGAAALALDLADFWQFRRLLELADLLDASLVQRFVLKGLASEDPDVREAAEEYRGGARS